MALPILDGNQSATTLSTILSSGQHITAHTVVSLGTQAITDIVNATSAGLTNTQLRASAVTVGGTVTVGNSVTISSLPAISGTVTVGQIQGYQHTTAATSGPYSADVILVGEDIEAGKAGALVIVPTARGGSVLGGRTSQGDTPICVYGDNGSAVTISGTVTVGNTVTIAGTVTANPTGTQTIAGSVTLGASTAQIGSVTASLLTSPTFSQDFADVFIERTSQFAEIQASIVSALPAGTNRIGVVTIGAGTVTIGAGTAQIGSVTASISGTVPVSGTFFQGTQPVSLTTLPALVAGTAQIGSVTASISNSVTIASLPAISGTVTANSSNGSLTTRFGSVTTANTAFATSAVTNANRKYLLIQNVTTASNVITVGIGFTPTTTQGIQLSSGAGLTFEGNYIPTGAVNLLSSVTASCFTILEA